MPTGMVTRLLQIRHARDVRRRRLRKEESTPKRGGQADPKTSRTEDNDQDLRETP